MTIIMCHYNSLEMATLIRMMIEDNNINIED